MKFLIKQISTSRTEIRLTLNSVDIDGIPYYMFGTTDSTFDEGTISSKYIPQSISNYSSEGPNPAIIRLIVAYLKDTLGSIPGFSDTVLTVGENQHIPIVNISVDDISLLTLSSDTVPSVVIKLTEKLPTSIKELDEVFIEDQILTTQEQEVYYIPKSDVPLTLRGLDYDEGMKDEVGNSDIQKLEYQTHDELTSSFAHTDKTVVGQILSGSDPNLKIDYSKFENHVHFGSAVSKLENFKRKVGTIETYLVQISQSLNLTSSVAVKSLREDLFTKIQDEKNSFTPYEKELYYNGDKLGFNYNINLGQNYIKNTPLNKETKLLNDSGFSIVHSVSGSNTGGGHIDLFKGLYNVEDKPFYNYSGSFYLSFLMKGDESIAGNIKWENYNEEYIPKLPYDTLYSSSVSEPSIKSGSWNRYIYHASMSYFTPISSIPIIGSPGSITDFTQGSSEIDILQGNNVTGSHAITVGGRYSNLATTVTSSGVSFTGSISPVGELFRIYVDTSYSTVVSSSYLTDIKITKYNPIDALPFSEIHKTGSSTFTSWYDEQYVSASDYDRDNVHALTNTLPEFLQHDNQMDNTTLRKFTNLSGEHFDLIKNYIDNYILLFKRDHTDASSNNLLPVLAKQQGWDFNIPFGKKEDGNLSEFMGSTISNINNTTDVKNNIWRNVLNSINYIYRTKGTHNSIRALLNSYGFPPDILKLREHGASMDQSDNTALSDDISNNVDGLGGTSGNVSFTTKKDKVVAYIIDTPNRKINAEWRRDSVDADGVEYIFKPVRSTNTQTILESSGSGTETLWDVILEPSASDNVKSRLQFRLNTSETGSLDITTTSNRVSMSTDYHDFRNQRFWNVLLQRTEGPSGSGENLLTSHSYQLAVGEQVDDKIKTLQIVSMSFGGTTYSQSAANWIGTGSRPTGTGGNLVVGETYTGSLLEFRTWKYALSASKFKQHIYDKKSVVGNSVTDSQTNLIYHFRLNENWVSGSSNPKIKDSNTSNLKDYSIDISNDTLGHTNLYDLDEFDRIQFNVGIGGASELSDNNIIIDADRRFINNLNPTEPSVLNLQDPLINKRKASSVVEIVRSPQDVINDFILNQLGNFDFNDKFADPQDINEPLYKDLETFAKDFFDYYDISMDINKYIRAQATIFNQDLIKSVKRLVPARAAFSKIGVELKPTFLERPKFRNNKIEQSLIGIGPSNIKYHTVDPNDDTPISDWENNVFLGKKIEPSLHQTKDTTIEIYSITGSKYYDFTDQYELYKTKDVFIEISSPTGSILNLVEEYIPNKDIHIEVASHTGSVLNLVEEYVPNKDIHIEVASHTGSILNLVEEYIPNKDIHIEVASHTGSVLNLVEEYIPNKDISIEISSHTGSVLNLVEEYVPNKDISIEVASHTGSVLNLVEEYVPNKDISIEVASHTGSVLNLVEEYVPNKDISIEVASHTGSVLNLTEEISNPHNSNLDISVGNQTKTGSLLLKSEVKSIHNIDIGVASATSSNPTLSTNLFTTKNGTFNFIGNDTLVDKLNSSYSDPIDSWGTSSNDTHFIHLTTGSEGKYGDYNTYHYEKRYIFNMIGDVETLSGSYTSISSSFFTDFTGTVTNGIYTASKDITNKTIISNEIGLGDRSLGITVGFKSTGSISFKGGKFLDETFVYPANHQFVVGTSKDSIDSLIYTGTQNNGGETLEFEAFGDLSNDAFYYVQTTGGSGYTIQYDA